MPCQFEGFADPKSAMARMRGIRFSMEPNCGMTLPSTLELSTHAFIFRPAKMGRWFSAGCLCSLIGVDSGTRNQDRRLLPSEYYIDPANRLQPVLLSWSRIKAWVVTSHNPRYNSGPFIWSTATFDPGSRPPPEPPALMKRKRRPKRHHPGPCYHRELSQEGIPHTADEACLKLFTFLKRGDEVVHLKRTTVIEPGSRA